MPPRVTGFPHRAGNDPVREGPSRRLRDRGRQLRASRRRRRAARLALRPGEEWCGVAPATSCSTCRVARRCSRRPTCANGYLPRRSPPIRPHCCCALSSRRAILVGTFDKPRYVTFTEDLCAHSRSRITGCNPMPRTCGPTGAIAPRRRSRGDRRASSARAAGNVPPSCPTGAASYAPAAGRYADAPVAHACSRLIREAGGTNAIVLVHDEAHGTPLIDAPGAFRRRLACQRAAVRRQ